MQIKTKWILGCGIAALAGVIAFAIVFVFVWSVLTNVGVIRAKEKVAVYDGMVFIYNKEYKVYTKLIASCGDSGTPSDIYLKVGDKQPVPLRSFREDGFDETVWKRIEGAVDDGAIFYDIGGVGFHYNNGKFKSFIISITSGDTKSVAVGPSANGKFATIPMTQEKLIEVFGEPLSYGKSTIMNP